MALIVYITEECRKEARNHSFEQALERFKERVEDSQDTRYFDPFPAPYLVKKQFGARQGRLVCERHPITVGGEEHIAIVFVAVLIRGERAYDSEFGKRPDVYGEKHFRGRFSQEELQKIVGERVKVDPPPVKEQPTDEEYNYLYQIFGAGSDSGEIVCESEEWVRQMADGKFANWHSTIFSVLSRGCERNDSGLFQISIPEISGCRLIGRKMEALGITFLAGFGTSDEEVEALTKRYDLILATESPVKEDILKVSERAYPEIVMAQGDLWLPLQKEKLGNLALSPEETEILEGAMHSNGAFPLFINGRAGSGKSTVLQYLFSDYLIFYLKNPKLPHPPVYFSCNHELLNAARKVVKTLIECGGKFWDTDRENDLDDSEEIWDGAFQEFHSFLRKLVPAEVREQRFHEDRYVDFAEFRRRWNQKFAADPVAMRDYNAELCWHVIRTYIKGTSLDELLDPGEYMLLDQRQRSVSEETYEWVYSKVWKRWYLEIAEEEGIWDDQDLGRYLIEEEIIEPMFPAIFCDEAQDFTRVELELILRLSLFSERKMDPTELSRVPFVFAGDQFQTLNPTGFRWEAVKAWFVEKFIFALDPTGRSGTDLNYRELRYNYRSAKPIVGFSNFVQAFRAWRFNEIGLLPQEPWGDSAGAPVMIFRPENADFWEALEAWGDVVFIVPCPEGDEISFIENDPELSKRIQLEEGVPSLPVLSAARAKGLEFERVVVYGFGKEVRPELLEPLRKGVAPDESSDDRLPLEYFVNRLYVAISRPKRQLVVVDDESGLENLWSFANEVDYEDFILKNIKKGHETWSERIRRPEEGNTARMEAASPADSEANAEEFAKRGRSRLDSYDLRQAAVAYRNLQKTDLATRCLAEADEIDGHFEKAGQAFLKLGDVESAVRCFWMAGGEGWNLLREAGESNAEIIGRIEYRFADFLRGEQPSGSGVKALETLEHQITAGNLDLKRSAVRKAWIRAIEASISKLLGEADAGGLESSDWQAIDTYLEGIRKAGIPIDIEARCAIASTAKNFEKAVTLYEESGNTDGEDYKKAKAESTQYPDRLAALAKLGSWDRILNEWEQNGKGELKADNAGAVALALAHAGRYEEALPRALKSRSFEILRPSTELLKKEEKYENIDALRALFAALAVKEARWNEVKALIDDANRLSEVEKEALVSGLARSREITELASDSRFGSLGQSAISSFLRKRFLRGDHTGISAAELREGGAAIERAGNRLDALKYYEQLKKHSSKDLREFAARRWFVCKRRQIDFDRERGDTKRLQERERELDVAKSGLGPEVWPTLSEYPELDPWENVFERIESLLDEGAVSSEPDSESLGEPEDEAISQEEPVSLTPVSVSMDSFDFRFFPQNGRLNIENRDSGESLSLKDWGEEYHGDWGFSDDAESGILTSEEVTFRIVVESQSFVIDFAQSAFHFHFGKCHGS